MSGLAYNLTPELEKQLIQKRVEQRQPLKDCAEWLSKIINRPVSYNGLSDWFKKRGLLFKDLGVAPIKESAVAQEADFETKVSTDKIIESYKARATYWEKAYKESVKSSSGIEDLIKIAREVTQAIPAVKVQT